MVLTGPSIERMRKVVQQWFLTEPLLFSVWTSHRIVPEGKIRTIRIGHGRIEVNPDFVQSMNASTLREVMKFEAVRILLKHPYERKKNNTQLSWHASNLAIQEAMGSHLGFPTAEAYFGTTEHNAKHFEYYYQLLAQAPSRSKSSHATRSGLLSNQSGEASVGESACEQNGLGIPSTLTPEAGSLAAYCQSHAVAGENPQLWDSNTFYGEQVNQIIADVQASQTWGSVPRQARELILASLVPKLDYRRVLQQFRANILSTQRHLTRMKPSRRYGFAQLGSRRDFSTKLLFAVDVSGSVSSKDLRRAFSIVNQFFRYGMESIDVIWFDTDIRCQRPLTLKRASRNFQVKGRGGTNFQPVMDYLDVHPRYDGLIVFTDGIAPVPELPKRNRRTRVVWLFNHESNWQQRHESLETRGMASAFVLSD